LLEIKNQRLQYFPGDNHNYAGKVWAVNLFSENVIVAAELEVKIFGQLMKLSADKTLQLQFSFKELGKFQFSLMTEAVRTSETSVNFNLNTRRYIPEDSKLQILVSPKKRISRVGKRRFEIIISILIGTPLLDRALQ
jgi:hypothetical protein